MSAIIGIGSTPLADDHGIDLIAVLFDAAAATIKMPWLLSMEEVPENSVSQKEKYALSPNVRPGSADRYRKFRHDNLQSLVAAVIRRIETGRAGIQMGRDGA